MIMEAVHSRALHLWQHLPLSSSNKMVVEINSIKTRSKRCFFPLSFRNLFCAAPRFSIPFGVKHIIEYEAKFFLSLCLAASLLLLLILNTFKAKKNPHTYSCNVWREAPTIFDPSYPTFPVIIRGRAEWKKKHSKDLFSWAY